MADENTPSWLASEKRNNDNSLFEEGDNVKEANPPTQSKPLSREQAREEERALNVRRGFTFLHLCGSVLMYTGAILSFAAEPGVSEAFIALYSFLFTTLIAAFELSRVYEMVHLEAQFSENFGFLYNHQIKGMYLIFIAFVNLGLSTSNTALEYCSCAWVLGDGVALTYFSMKKPAWFPLQTFTSPTETAQV